MKKRLEDMTLEELWQLFPIALEPHNAIWSHWAHEEIELLSSLLTNFHPVINHIGSTAIPDIYAKPIVDILVEVPADVSYAEVKATMTADGYICMSESGERMSFNKGYTPDGFAEKVFHIHFHRLGDNDEILFRDYLIANPSAAKEYERLKLGLLPTFKHNRDAYTDAKTPFVQAKVADAKNHVRTK